MAKRQKTVAVTRGFITGLGPTKADAKADMERQIDWALSAPQSHVEMRYGWIVAVITQPNGIASAVYRASELQHGQSVRFASYSGQVDFGTELEGARYHAAQCAWDHDKDDAGHIALAGLGQSRQADLAHWCAFQRRYAVEKAAGKSDRECHAIAAGYAH